MKILVSLEGRIVFISEDFQFGAWEQLDILDDKIVHKWKAERDGYIEAYIIDDNRGAIHGDSEPTLQVFEVDEFPSDFIMGKYLYIDGEFISNPNWVEPPKSDVERIAELEETVSIQKEQLLNSDEAVVSLYEMQSAQDEINLAQDEAITGLYEIMLGGE